MRTRTSTRFDCPILAKMIRPRILVLESKALLHCFCHGKDEDHFSISISYYLVYQGDVGVIGVRGDEGNRGPTVSENVEIFGYVPI